MAMNWSKWGRDFLASVLRHVGTAGLTTLSTSYVSGKMNWEVLLTGVVCGGIVPTVFTFLQNTPLPDDTVVTTPPTDATKTSP